MTEQNKARPFAVGDLVVCYLEDGSHVGVIKTINPYFVISPCFIDFGSFSLWTPDDHIITIRKPRKGGKEARDIVAMLAMEYKVFLSELKLYWVENNENTKEYWKKRKSGCFKNDYYYRYDKAKSMLGASDDN